MRLFGGKIGFVGSGIHSLSSQILSKSFRNWFENRTLRGTKKGEKFASLLFYCYNSCQTYFGSPKKFMGESFTNDFIILRQSFRNSSNILLTYISPYCL